MFNSIYCIIIFSTNTHIFNLPWIMIHIFIPIVGLHSPPDRGLLCRTNFASLHAQTAQKRIWTENIKQVKTIVVTRYRDLKKKHSNSPRSRSRRGSEISSRVPSHYARKVQISQKKVKISKQCAKDLSKCFSLYIHNLFSMPKKFLNFQSELDWIDISGVIETYA